MKLKLDPEEVLFAIDVYLALKGLRSTSDYYQVTWDARKGTLGSVEIKDVIPAEFDIDRLIERVKSK